MAVKKRIKERKMKKFSWIFALILALSIGFIGCPAPEEETKKGGGGDDSSSTGGTFGTGAGQVAVKKAGINSTTPIDPGTFNYLPDGSGFHYVYGRGDNSTDANWNYGNSILRFKIDLGDKTLDDYGYVTFDWQADGPYKTDVNSNKKLFLLASADEDDLTPYKDDGDRTPFDNDTDKTKIKSSMVSTTYFDTDHTNDTTTPSANNNKPWSDNTAPSVNGLAKVTIQLPILKMGMLGGEVWFAIYVHANGGGYTISNFRLGGSPDYVNPAPGTEAPDEPVVAPEGAAPFDFEVDLDYASSHLVANPASVNGSTSVADADYVYAVATGLTLKFTANNMRAYIVFKDDQITSIKNRSRKEVTIELAATAGGNTENFRYMIGHGLAGGDWNGTTGFGSAQITDDSKKNQEFGPNAGKDTDGAPDRVSNLIIQYQGNTATAGAPVIVTVTKVHIYTTPLEVTFDDGDVLGRSGDVTLEADGNGFTFVSTTDNYERAWAYFPVTLGTGYKLSDYKKISYNINGVVGSSGEGGWKDFFINAYADKDTIEAIPSTPAGDAACNLPTANQISVKTAWADAGIGDPPANVLAHTVDIKETLPAGTDLNVVWIVVRTAGKTGFGFKITDIKFY
jgi:hypothetical protein